LAKDRRLSEMSDCDKPIFPTKWDCSLPRHDAPRSATTLSLVPGEDEKAPSCENNVAAF
jgi:hypothetical protein